MASQEFSTKTAGVCFVLFFIGILFFGFYQLGRTRGYEEGATYVLETMK